MKKLPGLFVQAAVKFLSGISRAKDRALRVANCASESWEAFEVPSIFIIPSRFLIIVHLCKYSNLPQLAAAKAEIYYITTPAGSLPLHDPTYSHPNHIYIIEH